MKKFLTLVLKFSSPLILILAVYIMLDPFKVIWHYDSYYKNVAQGQVGINKDHVSTSTYDNYFTSENYNSFIFGNSRSMFYPVAEWKKHLPENSRPFHFDASGEALYSLHKKVLYVDKKQGKMDNVLLILDHETLAQDGPKTGHLFLISPQLADYNNYSEFHMANLRAFLSKKFFPAYMDFLISGKVKPYMTEENLLEDRPYDYDVKTNEVQFNYAEKLIAEGKYYTPERMAVFYERPKEQKTSPAAIMEKQKEMLTEMAGIFKKHNTNVKIIINPLYNQEKLNPADLAYLKQVFGENNVFDFSGINSITADYRNYYEVSHYRPHIAAQLLNEVYSRKK